MNEIINIIIIIVVVVIKILMILSLFTYNIIIKNISLNIILNFLLFGTFSKSFKIKIPRGHPKFLYQK